MEEIIYEVMLQPVDITNYVWVTAKKERIKVREMSTNHINNCILAFKAGRIPYNYLGGWLKWRGIFNEELIRRQ